MTNVKVWKRMKEEEREALKKWVGGFGMGGWHDYDCLHKRRPLSLRSHASSLLYVNRFLQKSFPQTSSCVDGSKGDADLSKSREANF